MSDHDARKLTPDALEDLRRRVMAAVQGGMGVTEAARTLRVTRQSVHNWINAVRRGGVRALRAGKRGPKRGSIMLASHQAAGVVRSITAGCPDQLRLPFALWTRAAVCALVERRHGIVISERTACRYLARWNLT